MPTAFGNWLKRERAERDLTLFMLEERTGFDTTHLSRIENGKTRPSRESVRSLAEAMGADVKEALMAAAFLPYDTPHLLDAPTQEHARGYFLLEKDPRDVLDLIQARFLAQGGYADAGREPNEPRMSRPRRKTLRPDEALRHLLAALALGDEDYGELLADEHSMAALLAQVAREREAALAAARADSPDGDGDDGGDAPEQVVEFSLLRG